MAWLVTGGAGYIGAHVVRALREEGEAVVVLDDLSTGARPRVPDDVRLVVGSTTNPSDVMKGLQNVNGVIHLAASKAVAESIADPCGYYTNNVCGIVTLLAAMAETGIDRLIYSSSAAVYGTPKTTPVNEQAPLQPASPYGETKLIGEWLTHAAAQAHGLRYVNLRYFNVAGAASNSLGDLGIHNLVPLAFAAISEGLAPEVFGSDYPTPDGSCIRDYIHVSDLATAHVAAVRLVTKSPDCAATYNVGTGRGYSVFEVLAEIANVTGVDVVPRVVPRRAGDPIAVVADAIRARVELGWLARHDLHDIVSSAWCAWQSRATAAPTRPR